MCTGTGYGWAENSRRSGLRARRSGMSQPRFRSLPRTPLSAGSLRLISGRWDSLGLRSPGPRAAPQVQSSERSVQGCVHGHLNAPCRSRGEKKLIGDLLKKLIGALLVKAGTTHTGIPTYCNTESDITLVASETEWCQRDARPKHGLVTMRVPCPRLAFQLRTDQRSHARHRSNTPP